MVAQKPSKLLGRVRFPSPALNEPRGVAQSGSAPGWGPGGRRFKSCLPDQGKALQTTIIDENCPRLGRGAIEDQFGRDAASARPALALDRETCSSRVGDPQIRNRVVAGWRPGGDPQAVASKRTSRFVSRAAVGRWPQPTYRVRRRMERRVGACRDGGPAQVIRLRPALTRRSAARRGSFQFPQRLAAPDPGTHPLAASSLDPGAARRRSFAG